jgi:hypothetical protein
MKPWIIFLTLYLAGMNYSFAQTKDTIKRVNDYSAHPYFIINAGETINAYYNDKPLSVESISDFTEYVQRNAKVLKDSRVVVTGKPKTGTYDDVLKTLSKYKIKNVTKNIVN